MTCYFPFRLMKQITKAPSNYNLLIGVLILLFSPISIAIDVPSSQAVNIDENKILRIVGWDVYADPISTNKTLGYKKFEKKYGVTIQFTPLSNLEDIINATESGTDYDVIIISNEGIHTLEQMKFVS